MQRKSRQANGWDGRTQGQPAPRNQFSFSIERSDPEPPLLPSVSVSSLPVPNLHLAKRHAIRADGDGRASYDQAPRVVRQTARQFSPPRTLGT